MSLPTEQQPLSDGCTGFPDMAHRACCVVHDIAYIEGMPRLDADLQLYTCVTSASGLLIALIMFIGVRLFGWAFYNKK